MNPKTPSSSANSISGLRWIFEALAGGDLSDIDTEWFYDKAAEDSEQQAARVKREFVEVTEILKKKKHVIVGHNLFADLAFLFKTFVGHLPVNVKHFQEDVHALFPFVIDTKYIATYGADAMNPRVNLKELLTPFRKTHVPLIVLHEKHTSYGADFGKEHEAGFDSWMTAELFVKLAASKRLEAKALVHEDSSSDSDSDPDSSNGGAILFDSEKDSFVDENPPAWHAKQLNLSAHLDVSINGKGKGSLTPKQWLPSFNSKFWDPYINKLRVNASEGGVCDLAEREEDERLDGLRRHRKMVIESII